MLIKIFDWRKSVQEKEVHEENSPLLGMLQFIRTK
jgi:hypothetical protein